jgi:MoaA/NifB/PqqE/SkfB family radical SAM enzyme
MIDWKGDCFLCGCEIWLPVSAGQIESFESLDDVWNSSTAQALQKDIDTGAFTHCAVDRCGILDRPIKHTRYEVNVNIDLSCNLECPSCRPNKIMITSGGEYDKILARSNHICQLLEKFEHPCHIVMSGNGDPLASSIMRPLIHKFKPTANQTIRLYTNGLLLKKQLSDAPILKHITQYFISIDAGSETVYEQVRKGGKWKQLILNLTWLRDNTKTEVLLMFVLQKSNYNDMQNFCELCSSFGFNGVINLLENWGSWGDNFNDHDVIGNKSHPEHDAAIAKLRSIYKNWNNRIQFDSSLTRLCV